MPPTRRKRSVADQPVNFPADLDLEGMYVKDLRTLCNRLKLPTTGIRATLVQRLEEVRQNAPTPSSSPTIIPATTNGDSPTAGDHADNLQQQFVQLQQQVQGLLNRESSDERVLSESQLTQVQSLVQATINDTIERTATAAAQAAVNAFNGASPPAANVPDRNAPDEDTNSRSVQELLRSSAPDGTSRIDLAIASTSQQRPSDSVHELPAKLVKEILSGEFMELSKLSPQNFNSLQPFYDEPLTLTLENSVIRVNKTKATSITDIEEWTSAFTAYMSVIISTYPPRAAELLEYLSLIRYAAKYHRGLGCCVYDIKFRQKAAANRSLKWSAIDSQLWLKTFTVAPSLMKEEIGVFQSGPSSAPSTFRGNQLRTCHNYNKGFPCARTPYPYAHKCNKPRCGRDHPGIECLTPSESARQPSPRVRKSHPQQHSARHRDK